MSQDSGRGGDESATSREVLVALGGNLPSPAGPPATTIRAAAEAVESALGPARLGRLYVTPAFPPGSGPDYVNAAMALQSARPATEILATLHDIDARFARERTARWAGRTLDLDLLACGDAILPDRAAHDGWRRLGSADQSRLAPAELILPHPRLQDRGFVLVPLAEVAPGWRHPVIGATVREMLAALPAEAPVGIRPLAG